MPGISRSMKQRMMSPYSCAASWNVSKNVRDGHDNILRNQSIPSSYIHGQETTHDVRDRQAPPQPLRHCRRHPRRLAIFHAGYRERRALQTGFQHDNFSGSWRQYNIPITQADQCRASQCGICRAEAGPTEGPAVVLLHGWPYDIYSFVEVTPQLAAAGYRVIVPYLRGYGTTTFLSGSTFRNGQPSAIAADIIALMDALGIEKATLAGFDWDARTANIIAALWPERCRAMVSVSGYLIGNQTVGKTPLPPKAELQWWYQFYFATERGRRIRTISAGIFKTNLAARVTKLELHR
jgi:hypothetical protein